MNDIPTVEKAKSETIRILLVEDDDGSALVLKNILERSRYHIERCHAQQSLLESEERYRTLFAQASEGIMVMPVDGEGLTVNESFARMHGYSPQEMENLHLQDLDTPETAQLAPARLRRLTAGEKLNFEVEHYHKDGHSFPLSVSCNMVRLQGQLCLLGFHRDITERKRAEEELRFRNAILSTQQEASIDGILVVDEDGRIISSNRRFADMWGIPPDIIASKSDEHALESVMGKLETPEEFLSKVRHLYKARDETSQEDIALKDGRTFSRYSAPMLGAEGKYYGRVWYFRDITDRKQAEQKLKEYRDHLEKLVEVRTDDLERKEREVKILRGLLPICAWCKHIRDDKGYWHQIESYIRDHSEAEFSHGICPKCAKRLCTSLGPDGKQG